jgi:hypothetical protein
MANNGFIAAAVILGLLVAVGFVVILTNLPDTPVIPECKPVVLTVQNTTVVKELVTTDYKDLVVKALMKEVAKDNDYRECSGHYYDLEEIAVKKVYAGFTLTENSDEDLEISDVQVKLNYDDGDCYKTLTCSLDADKDLSC